MTLDARYAHPVSVISFSFKKIRLHLSRPNFLIKTVSFVFRVTYFLSKANSTSLALLTAVDCLPTAYFPVARKVKTGNVKDLSRYTVYCTSHAFFPIVNCLIPKEPVAVISGSSLIQFPVILFWQ